MQDDAHLPGHCPTRTRTRRCRGEGAGGGHGPRVRRRGERVSPAQSADAPPAASTWAIPTRPATTGRSTTASWSAPAPHGLKVMITLAPPIPDWASEEPSVLPALHRRLPRAGRVVPLAPAPRMFFQFAKAAARRYAGRVDLWSLYNEPNLEHYLYPQLARVGRGGSWTWPPCATASSGSRAGRRSPSTTRRGATRSCSGRPRRSARRWTRSTPRSAWTRTASPSGGG